MTEDFARDMRLLKDLLLLANSHSHGTALPVQRLQDIQTDVETRAGILMEAVTNLKLAFNEQNRKVMMGFWIAGFEDPIDPYGAIPPVQIHVTEQELLDRARVVGTQLIELLDIVKDPHKAFYDTSIAGQTAAGLINEVRTLPGVVGDLNTSYKWLGDRLDALTSAFTGGGAGGESTYWPSNYVSSSSSSSSSSSFP